MTIHNTALEVGRLLGEAEAAHPSSPQLAALHDELRRGLYRHSRELGLSKDELREIDGQAETFGGTPKTPPDKD